LATSKIIRNSVCMIYDLFNLCVQPTTMNLKKKFNEHLAISNLFRIFT